MKKFKVIFTENCGTTYQHEIVTAENLTAAYISVYKKLPLTAHAAITDIIEINEGVKVCLLQ